jgi:uncharacterized protein (TIGR02611 family)
VSSLVRLSELIAQQRDKEVLEHARPHLEADEDVVCWARARHPDSRQRGFAFVTDRKLLVVWQGRKEAPGAVAWEDVRSWGVAHEEEAGPLLGVEFDRSNLFVRLPVTSRSTAGRVTRFLRNFAGQAPSPRWHLVRSGHGHRFRPEPGEVRPARRSLSGHTKRVIATVIGLVLVVVGAAIIPIPGPWSLPVMLTGLAILASEYDWAEDVLDWSRHKARKAREKLKARRAER